MSHPYKSRPVAETHVWLTPPSILDPLGEFDLDPCASENWPTANLHYTADGLERPWSGRVWLNPPYGRNTAAWLKKMADHADGIALVFARTDTKMFQDHVWPHASGVLFLAGRPHFHHADGTRAKGNCGGPMALISYDHGCCSGPNRDILQRAIEKGKIHGHYLEVL